MKFITTYLSPVKWAFLSACLLSLIHVVSALTVPTLTASIINEGVCKATWTPSVASALPCSPPLW